MITELTQKGYFEKRCFEILDDKVIVKRFTYKENLEYYIRFEELGFDVFRKTEKVSNIALFFLGLLDCMYVYLLIDSIIKWDKMIIFWSLVLVGFLIITVIYYVNRHKSFVFLVGGNKTLELFNDKPTSNTVNEFITSIHDRMRAYYKNKYAVIDLSVPKEYSISQFKWLKDIKAINESEYKQLIEILETQHLL